jgi:Holliday junction DNA helicase RuvA
VRVLGIDPGLTRCGMGVVEGSVGRPLTLVDVNVIRTSSTLPVAERLVSIEKGVDAWIEEHRPDAVAVERVFARSDVSTVMGTAQASGIAMVCAARRGLPIALHTPSEVKAGRRRRRAGAGHHPHLARRRPGPPGAGPGPQPRRSLPVIAFVRGPVAAVTLSSAVLEVGGVGLELMCTPGTLATLSPKVGTGQTATLPTSMVVREDSLTLFGFLDEDEKTCFELLQTASGVGPKLAQAMLAVLSPDDLRAAVSGEDVKTLTRVPGIGQKGAQRIILELKDRLGAPVGSRAVAAPRVEEPWRDQVRQGLQGLGWSAKDADRAVDEVAPGPGETPDVAALLRAALRALSKA